MSLGITSGEAGLLKKKLIKCFQVRPEEARVPPSLFKLRSQLPGFWRSQVFPNRFLQVARLVSRKVRVSIFTPCVSISRDSRSPEEKPITVDRPNRTYVLYRASAMKFDTKGETHNETPSCLSFGVLKWSTCLVLRLVLFAYI